MSFWPCDGPECPQHALFLRGDCCICGQHLCATHFHDDDYCLYDGLPPSEWPADRHSPKQYETECREVRAPPRQVFGSMLTVHQMEGILRRLDLPRIIRQAQDLRPGFTCAVPHLSPTMEDVKAYPGAGMNFHIPLTWSDGAEWLVRARRKRQLDPPPEAKATVLRSEVATLKAMREAGVLAPEAFLPETDMIRELPGYQSPQGDQL